MIMKNDIEEFVTEGSFVVPEKLEAVKMYGLDKAKEIFSEGATDVIHKLRLRSFCVAQLPFKEQQKYYSTF